MTHRRYRVLHVITRLDLGGAQQNTLYSCAHHDRAQFEVRLIAGRGGLLDAEAERLEDVAVELVPWLSHPVSAPADAGAVMRLRRYMEREGIDLVHTHSSKAGIVGRLAAHLARVPVVVHTVHGWSFNPTQSPARRALYRSLERTVAPLTDRLVTVSERNRETGVAHSIGRPEQYVTIRSGIDPAAWSRPERAPEAVRAELGFDARHRVVGTVACLKPQKAPLDFVRVAAAAAARDPHLRFFIAGDGELREETERAIERAGLTDVIRVLGWRRDVVDLLHAMDLFLLTSRFEGLPRSVLQAMAAGTPVVASAVDGTPEVVRDRVSGMLFEAGRVEQAAERLIELLGDRDLRDSCVRGARALLTAEFDIAEMVRRLDRLYLAELAGRQPVGIHEDSAVRSL